MENISYIIMGIVIGIASVIMSLIIYQMIRMNLDFMMWRKVRDHEEEFHAKELKEREKGE